MAISSNGASYAALKLPSCSRPSPPLLNDVTMSFKPTLHKQAQAVVQKNVMSLAAKAGGLGSLRGGAGLLERPTFDQSQFDALPEVQEGGDIGRLRDRKGLGNGDSYKVLLVDDSRHTEKLVASALPQAVPSVTADDARKLFHESRQIGVAVVIVTVKEHAEFYAQMMLRKGIRSAIEPDTNSDI